MRSEESVVTFQDLMHYESAQGALILEDQAVLETPNRVITETSGARTPPKSAERCLLDALHSVDRVVPFDSKSARTHSGLSWRSGAASARRAATTDPASGSEDETTTLTHDTPTVELPPLDSFHLTTVYPAAGASTKNLIKEHSTVHRTLVQRAENKDVQVNMLARIVQENKTSQVRSTLVNPSSENGASVRLHRYREFASSERAVPTPQQASCGGSSKGIQTNLLRLSYVSGLSSSASSSATGASKAIQANLLIDCNNNNHSSVNGGSSVGGGGFTPNAQSGRRDLAEKTVQALLVAPNKSVRIQTNMNYRHSHAQAPCGFVYATAPQHAAYAVSKRVQTNLVRSRWCPYHTGSLPRLC